MAHWLACRIAQSASARNGGLVGEVAVDMLRDQREQIAETIEELRDWWARTACRLVRRLPTGGTSPDLLPAYPDALHIP